MIKKRGRRGLLFFPAVALMLAAGGASAAESNIKMLAAGLSYDHFSRTVAWEGDEASSKILFHRLSATADFGVGNGLVLSLSAGLSLSDFAALTFGSLPISLEFGGAPLKGLALGAELVAPVHKRGDFEIAAAGRFVYSFGMSKTWPLEGFAVEGNARGMSDCMETAIGPRVSYLFFGRVVPYLEVSVRWLWADFGMTETLGDLVGEERKQVGGDISFSAALGADAKVSDRLLVKAKGGIVPFAGGVDGSVSIGILYGF